MRSREILQRLLRQPDPVRIFATVQSVTTDGRYRVTDDQGRSMTVDGEAGYLPQVAVIIQLGRIVGTGRRPAVTKIYRV
ncbi:hypothetical protein [Desulfopila aestuarii]|uniref:Uncharacterized protein n=1 Tax=Desulfopila aestuarii DSM 18488 TaxID=1121416 RepID=A0A1M7YJN7_9BACT|nr:hypothetical protein [Desulfopila aestuarii]SHO52827.1 hypothetical protein SAMN02745220_04787 [Desulfopila aestuarii DSM 18488]